MVYKFCNCKDLHTLPPISEQVMSILQYHTQVLTKEYGTNRDINGDGGYVLYLTPDGVFEEIEAYFNYSANVIEYIEYFEDICVIMYLLNNEFCVTIVASLASLPPALIKEINDI